MTSKQTKRIAFLLAASLLMNTVALPVSAESDVVIVGEAPTEAPTEAPVEIVTEAPTEAPPTEAATETPTEEVTEAPTQEATEATTEAPTEETTEAPTEAPTEEATEAPTEKATEEPTEPLTREDILAAQQEGYAQALAYFRSMDISDDRSMSLEWWCVMTGNVSMREPDYSILDAEADAPQEEAAEKTWADYIVFSEVISVRSASDLILLSYVSPSLYMNRTVTLFADAGNEFDLVHPLSISETRTLSYRGLGDLGSPFSGTIRYAENSENITFILDAPLFIGLSTKAKFLNRFDQPNTVYLVSKAGYAFDGLLARHVLGEQQNEANWFVQLNAPDFSSGGVYVLPSLLGILYGNANVNLLLTDNSYLSPSYRGYLCATMYAQSSLSAAGITRKLSVPLVGEVSPDATLTTDAPQEEVTEPTEEVTEPTEEVTEPTEETTAPTEEVTEPTEETTEPTEEVTEPTEEVTEPTTSPIDRDALLAEQEEGYQQALEYYRSMAVSLERTMPLEWWYVVTGRVSMRQPDYPAVDTTTDVTTPSQEPEATEEATAPTEEVTEATEATAAPTEEATEATEETTAPTKEATEATEAITVPTEEVNGDWSAYVAFPDDITVSSDEDLILLSYVAPSAYQERTIIFAGEQGFDLSQSVLFEEQLLTYQGLGNLDAPYSGVLCFNGSASIFVLSAPLFVGLSTAAKFQNQLGETAVITLVSKAFSAFDGLLAAHVLSSAESTADWTVQLADPAYRADGAYLLPSLFGVIHESASVSLKLLDNSTLPPCSSGYLCTAMEAGTYLDATNIIRRLSTPLVGTLAEGATLKSDRPSNNADGTPIFYTDMSAEEFQTLANCYASLPVESGKMSLEWWFAVCGKLDDLRTYLTWKGEQEVAAHPVTLPLFPDTPIVIDVPDATAEAASPIVVSPISTGTGATASVQDGIAVFAAENTSGSPVFFAGEAPVTFDSAVAAEAADDTTGDDTSGTTATEKPNLNISKTEDLVKLSKVAANQYRTETITITASDTLIDVRNTGFAGLGDSSSPFAGNVQYATASEKAPITLNQPFFNYLSADATIKNINLTWAGAANTAILAGVVKKGATMTSFWNVTLGSYTVTGNEKDDDYRLPTLIGTIEEGATVTLSAVNGSKFTFGGQGFFCDELKGTLTVTYPDTLPAFNTTKNNVGGMVGTMAEKATLTVKGGDIVIDVATSGSTAGGLVGKMESGAKLNVTADSLTVNQVTAAVADDSSVGTLVGEATNPTFAFTTVSSIAAGTATESHGYHLNGYHVGGLVGKLTTSASGLTLLPVSGLNLRGINCGGMFGELDNSARFTLSGYTTVVTLNRQEPDLVDSKVPEGYPGSSRAGSAGGLIGLYIPTAGDTTLSVSKVSTTVKADDKPFNDLGGFIGAVTATGDNTYIALTDCTVTTLSTNAASPVTDNLGGFVGKLSNAPVHLKVSGSVTFGTEQDNERTGGLVGLAEDNGHLIEVVGDFTLNANSLSGSNSGGLVGEMQSGVVYMNAAPTLEVPKFDKSGTHGWIVGKRGNALVCTNAAWTAPANGKDSQSNNDTGVWGQVLQLSKFDTDLVKLDSANHTVTIKEPTGSSGSYTAGSLTEFAALALRVQLNDVGMLKIPNDSEVDKAKTITLTLGGDIDLTGTGLTGLTPDCSPSMYSYPILGFVINGAKNTVTLPNVPIFASGSGHNYQGLIARCNTTLKLTELTVTGGSTVTGDSQANIQCGIVSDVKCDATVESVTSEINWTIAHSAKSANVSGFIGAVTASEKNISFQNSKWDGVLTDETGSGTTCIMGGFLGDSENKSTNITVTGCTVSGTVQNTVQKNNKTEAMVGGLFGRLWKCSTLTVSGLNVTDATVKTTSQKTSGGLLGYELYCNTATFDGVTVSGATLNTNAKFGGLIYKGAGYWKVTGNGIRFQSATITGITDDTTPSGLLVSVGCSGVENYGGLYLEVGYNAYQIDKANVTLALTGGNYFDELVGRSIQAVGSGQNGIVSIATNENEPIDTDGCNTYQKQLATDYTNPRTRYYYNLDKFRIDILGDTISTAAQMVLWSAYSECKKCTTDGTNTAANSQLYKYFANNSTHRTISGNAIDLTGYSFYPVAYDGTSIQGATITFGFEQLETTEKTAANKQPSDTLRQHAGMHTGIFTDITTYNAVLTVNNLTLRGTVGGLDGKYGALVRGNIVGRFNTGDAKNVVDTVLNINGVTLDSIRVYPDLTSDTATVAPLLIYSIGNYVTLRLTNVVTTSSYITQSVTKAASSLIGKVGSGSDSTSIDLEFSKIQLTPPSSDADTDCKRNNCTLFTRALFLESFQYATGCRGVYNFKRDDNYTIGQEVSNTTSGRNLEKQYWFFDEWGNATGYVCGENNAPADYYKAYTRYVYQAEVTGSENYKELDVNLQPLDLTDGCGTYSDPYRITSGGVLSELAKALNGGGSNPSWKVNISTAVLPDSSAIPSFSRDDGHTHEAAANGQELVLVCGEKGKGWSIAVDDTTSDTGDTAVRATEAQMLSYLRNAYYMITEDITLPSDWAGLGTTAAPFRGVIVGGSEPAPTVTVTSATSARQFGGLIQFSQGSVVKNLSIRYPDSFTLTSGDSNILNYDSAVFFGGVVGCCMAGDTVIDGVSVTLPKVFTVTGNNANYAAIGGYVGLVGGANNQGGGGVVFRGSVRSTWQPNNNLYTNPFVGRVLDGYAVSETAIDNTNKNYTIPTLSSPSLTLSDGSVTVGNAGGLWLLSAMENSRHSGAYSNGKPRSSEDYEKVGTSMPGGVSDESGSGTQTNYYLWKHHGIASPLPTSFKLVFTGSCDMSAFGNGFRGIGVSQGTFRAYLRDTTAYPLITEIDGGGCTVTLAQTRAEPMKQYVDWAAMGAGLFPILNADANLSIHSLTLAGTASLTVGDILTTSSHRTLTSDYQRTQVGVGMLAGALVSKQGTTAAVTLTGIHASGTVSTTAPLAGGLIGYCGSPVSTISNDVSAFSKLASISVTDCSFSGTVNGSTSIGGFIGLTYANAVTVSNCRSDGGITLGVRGPKDDGKLWNYGNWEYTNTSKACSSDGLGGIIGTASETALQVDGVTLNGVTILANNGADGTVDTGFGGIVGAVSTTAGSSNWLKNITMTGTVSIQDMKGIHVSAGFLIGYLADTNFNGWNINDGSASSFEISNVNIGSDAGSAITLKGFQVGGLIGMLKDGKVALKIGGETVNADGTKTPLPVRIGNAAGKNGSISANNFSNADNKPSLGGLIGIVCNMPTIDIQNLYLGGITVNKANFNSLILAKSTKANATIRLKNAEIVSCSLTKTGDNETGFLLGSSNGDKTIYEGFNILLKDCTTDANGLFAGKIDDEGHMYLVAVGVVNCTGGKQDFNASRDCYVIRSDYTGAQTYQASSASPWVDVNPLSNLNDKVTGVSPVTGDGAAFMADGKTPIGTQIAADGKFYNVSEAMAFFKGTNVSGISLAPFSTAGGNTGTGMPDFPVLLLPAVSKAEVNTAVYNYISLLTNYSSTATTLSGKLTGSITAKTYQWKDTQFEEAAESSITVDASGRIYATPGKYDNTLNQFTLLTVSYQDPTDSSNSYKLYIPIVVQKLLNYHFYASAIPGTIYSTKAYESASLAAVTSHGEQITVLLTYAYEKTKDELQGMVDSGENLLWNFDKNIVMNQSGNEGLPAGTKLTLVDRNNKDKVYYAITDEVCDTAGNIAFNKFSGFCQKDEDGNVSDKAFLLCDSLGLEATKSTDGLFVVEKDTTKATVRIRNENGEYVYYRLADSANEADAGKDRFAIEVKKEQLVEEYYLTIQTPASATVFSNVTVQCEHSLGNSTGNKTIIPNRLISSDSRSLYTRNGAENRILFGNFFQTKLELTTSSEEMITNVNPAITGHLSFTLTFTNDTWRGHFADYANNVGLYQRFEIYATDWLNGVGSPASFYPCTVNTTYSKNGEKIKVGETVYTEGQTLLDTPSKIVLNFPEQGMSLNTNSNDTAKLEADFTVTFTATRPQFHTKSEEHDGLQLVASSYMAFSNRAALDYSNNPSTAYDDRRFYLEETSPVKLTYNVSGSDVDARVSQLGINGRVETTATINTFASFDVRNLEAARDANTIFYTFTLYCKNTSGEFEKVKITEENKNLLTVAPITATLLNASSQYENVESGNGTIQAGTIQFSASFSNGLDISDPIRIPVTLTVTSGDGFKGTYANYKVELTVWLQKGNVACGSSVSDYIIYTNAKIKFPLVTSN